jgi:hypothetical protein
MWPIIVDPVQTVPKPIFFAPAKARNTHHRVKNPSESTLLDCVFSHHKGWNWYHCVATCQQKTAIPEDTRVVPFFFYQESLVVLEMID